MEGGNSDERDKGGILVNGLIGGMPVFVKELIAGGVAGGVAKTAVAPLERIKILFQTRRSEFHSLGLFGSFTKIAKTEGILGLYRGNGASVARIVPYAALHYMTYEEYRKWIILGFPDVGRGPVLDLVAGSFAGGTAVLFTYPLDLVRTKLAYQDSSGIRTVKTKYQRTLSNRSSLQRNSRLLFQDIQRGWSKGSLQRCRSITLRNLSICRIEILFL